MHGGGLAAWFVPCMVGGRVAWLCGLCHAWWGAGGLVCAMHGGGQGSLAAWFMPCMVLRGLCNAASASAVAAASSSSSSIIQQGDSIQPASRPHPAPASSSSQQGASIQHQAPASSTSQPDHPPVPSPAASRQRTALHPPQSVSTTGKGPRYSQDAQQAGTLQVGTAIKRGDEGGPTPPQPCPLPRPLLCAPAPPCTPPPRPPPRTSIHTTNDSVCMALLPC